jgi:1-acyl-sn-glycerol-3-phosphate acyltransferase
MMRETLAKHLRATSRVVALCAATASLYFLWLAVAPFALFSSNASRNWRGFIFRAWARAVSRIAGMRANVRGVPPRGAFLLVSNHLSYMDVVALASRLSCVFVAKSEVARWPVIGLMCRSMNTIFVNRQNRRSIPVVLNSVERSLAEGSGVVLFAEGTSTSGANVAPFRSSLLELAARKQTPVHFASLSYRTPPGEVPARESVCWWGDRTFPGHLYGLFMLPSFEVSMTFGEQPIRRDDRKVLARELWSAVKAEFIPVV